MAHSIEARVPFLDHRLVEYALSLPTASKLRGAETKSVMRRALAGTLPEAVRSRRDKIGFRAEPGVTWALGARQRDALLATRSSYEERWLDGAALGRLIDRGAGLRCGVASSSSGARSTSSCGCAASSRSTLRPLRRSLPWPPPDVRAVHQRLAAKRAAQGRWRSAPAPARPRGGSYAAPPRVRAGRRDPRDVRALAGPSRALDAPGHAHPGPAVGARRAEPGRPDPHRCAARLGHAGPRGRGRRPGAVPLCAVARAHAGLGRSGEPPALDRVAGLRPGSRDLPVAHPRALRLDPRRSALTVRAADRPLAAAARRHLLDRRLGDSGAAADRPAARSALAPPWPPGTAGSPRAREPRLGDPQPGRPPDPGRRPSWSSFAARGQDGRGPARLRCASSPICR